MAVSPPAGLGTQQQFSFQATDSLAATDLTTLGILFNSSTNASNACTVIYNRAQNTLSLLTDAGAAPAGSLTPGSGSQQNSQCALNGSGSTVSSSGNTLTVNLALTFLAAFTGTKNVYMDATNPFETVNWQSVGTWITAATPAMSVSPASGNAAQETFSLQVSDPLGAADLTTVGLLFNATASTTGACAVIYNQAQNALLLLTDAGAQPVSSITPGSGTQQNSQCVLNGAGSSASASGSVLTVNICLDLSPSVQRREECIRRSCQQLSDGDMAVPRRVEFAAGCDHGGEPLSGLRHATAVQLSSDGFVGSDGSDHAGRSCSTRPLTLRTPAR